MYNKIDSFAFKGFLSYYYIRNVNPIYLRTLCQGVFSENRFYPSSEEEVSMCVDDYVNPNGTTGGSEKRFEE